MLKNSYIAYLSCSFSYILSRNNFILRYTGRTEHINIQPFVLEEEQKIINLFNIEKEQSCYVAQSILLT
jgi:hypothetical protein